MNNLQDTASAQSPSLAGSGEQQRHLALQTRTDPDGTITYHSLVHDTTGGVTEKVYDVARRLIKVVRRSGSSRCETYLDPLSGARTRVNEIGTMPDGNLISSDVVYSESSRSSQVVTVFRPNGLLIRITERESRDSKVVYQGQTDYDVNGAPAVTFNQHTDPATSLLMHREQIHWMSEGARAMTEHFYFDIAGNTVRYVKILHQSGGGPFSEETQEFDPSTHKLVRRELLAFDQEGVQTCLDVLHYGGNGEVAERKSTFFDASGRPLVTRSQGEPGSYRPSIS